MTIPNRTVSISGVFAESAITTIPQTPVPGTSYRDTSMTATQVKAGWPFKTIVDSGKFNQALFQYSTICSQIEKYGFLPWSSLTNYVAGSLCLGSDGVIYQAKQNTGPSSTAKDPTTDTANTYWEDFVGSTYVTLGTNQTISATKTFTANPVVSNNFPQYSLTSTEVTKGTAPSSVKNEFLGVAYDKNGFNQSNKLGQIYVQQNTNGGQYIAISCAEPTNGSTNFASILIGYDGNKAVYTSVPMPVSGSSTTNNSIASCGWCNDPTRSLNVVHRSGDETIGGTKTFSTNVYMETSGTSGRFYSKNTALDLTNTSRANDIGIGFRSVDKNDNIAGEFTNVFTTTGTSSAVVQVRNRASGSQTTAQIKLNIDKNGNVSTECPTPTSATDNSTKIATTAWVNRHLSNATTKSTITGWGVPNYDSAVTITSPYTPTKNGIIIVKVVGGSCTCDISKGSTVISRNQSGDSGSTTNAVWAIVKSGEQYTIKTYGTTTTLLFVPFVGG